MKRIETVPLITIDKINEAVIVPIFFFVIFNDHIFLRVSIFSGL